MRSTASAPVPSRQETPASAGKKWLVTCAVMSGTFLAVMDVSVVNVSMPHMMGYRILQGVGGGSLSPISQDILREIYPLEEQGMAMAIFGMGVVLAPGMGPSLGGWLTDNYGWPWVFYINIPVSIVGILMVS